MNAVKPRWGLHHVVPDSAIAAWGARLIVTQDGEVDMLPDRQGSDDGPHADELLTLLNERFTIPTMRDILGELLVRYEMSTREGEDFILFMDDRMVVHANTNGSAGYCYVTAWLYLAGICKHCERHIVYDEEGWIDPEAGYDDDNDGIWRTVCDRHETFLADHEPVEVTA